MQVIILCGGYGTRLKEETEFKPKPLVRVGGEPMLWHIIQIYRYYGYHNFILALGYKGDRIKDYCVNELQFVDFKRHTATESQVIFTSDQKDKQSITITLLDTGLNTLPGERVARCSHAIPEDDRQFMLTYGDGVADINIRNVVSFHQKNKVLGTICGVHPRSKFGLIKTDKKNHVISFIEKPVLVDWVNGGFMIFDRDALTYFRSGEMEHEAVKRLMRKKQLAMYPHEGFWFAVDTYKELEDLNTIWKKGNAPWHIW